MPPRTRDQYLLSGGARLRYRDDGTGPALLLIHGWTLDLEMWEPLVDPLAGSFRLVRLDRRGHGLSTGNPGLDGDVADLNALCQHLGLGKIALLGMSQGARSALAFANAAPATVRALVLDGAPNLERTVVPGDIPLAHYRALLQAEGIEAFRRHWQQHPHMQLRATAGAGRDLLDAMLRRYNGRDLMEGAGDAAPAMTGMVLDRIEAPTLVLNGEFDLDARSAAAQYLCRQLPTTERAIIKDAGHLASLDNPAGYAAVCRAFLSRYVAGISWR